MGEQDKERRMKEIQRRFRTVQDRQVFTAQWRKAIRSPKVWLLAFLVFVAALALMLGLRQFS